MAMTAQSLIDLYAPRAVLVFGIAGSTSSDVSFADVVVPARWASLDLRVWTRAGYNRTEPLPLEGIDYSRAPPAADFQPTASRGGFFVQEAEVMNPEAKKGFTKQLFFDADPELLAAADAAMATMSWLRRCNPSNESQCMAHQPRAYRIGAGASGSILVDNAAFRNFLQGTYNVSVWDMETAAAAHTCKTAGVPYLGVRSASDLAGAGSGNNTAAEFTDVAAINAANVMVTILKQAFPVEKGRPGNLRR